MVEAENKLQLVEPGEKLEERHKKSNNFYLENDIWKAEPISERVERYLFDPGNQKSPNGVYFTPSPYL